MHKTVLITGASRGIGRAAALRFAKAGWRVGAGYCASEEEARTLIAELAGLGAMAAAVRGDVADAEDAARMVRETRSALGHIDVLINNADTDYAAWRRLFAVNVDGAYHCAKAVLPDMISRQSGVILNVSSIWGLVGASCEVGYSASKAALIGFTKALAKELGPSGIRVNCVAPGVIDTGGSCGSSLFPCLGRGFVPNRPGNKPQRRDRDLNPLLHNNQSGRQNFPAPALCFCLRFTRSALPRSGSAPPRS